MILQLLIALFFSVLRSYISASAKMLLQLLVALCFFVLRTSVRVSAFIQAVTDVAAQPPTPPLARASRFGRPSNRPSAAQCVPAKPYINALPNEILTIVFKMIYRDKDLFNCMTVCQRWQVLVTPVLWKAPFPARGVCCCSSSPRNRELLLSHKWTSLWSTSHKNNSQEHRLSASFPVHIAKYGTSIRRLTMAPRYTSDCSVRHIAEHCPNLKRISLENCKQITDISLLWLSTGCERLESIKLTHCTQITDKGLLYLSRLTRLSNIELGGCYRITTRGVLNLVRGRPDGWRALDLTACTGIKSVEGIVRECGASLAYLAMADIPFREETIQAIVDHCPQLLVLKIPVRSSFFWTPGFLHYLRRFRNNPSISDDLEKFVSHARRYQVMYKRLVGGLADLEYLDADGWPVCSSPLAPDELCHQCF